MVEKARMIISLEVPSELDPVEAEFVEQTLRLHDMLGVAATWASADITNLQSLLGRYQLTHEIALSASGESNLSDRTRLANWLLEKTENKYGQPTIRTLFADASIVRGQLDLLVKHRISTLAAEGSVADQREQLERFGVVTAPAALHLDGEFAWWAGGPRGAVRRALHQAIQAGGTLHVAARVREIVSQQRQEGLWAALRDAAHRQRYGLIQISPLRDLAHEQRVLRTGTGRSILRAA